MQFIVKKMHWNRFTCQMEVEQESKPMELQDCLEMLQGMNRAGISYADGWYIERVPEEDEEL